MEINLIYPRLIDPVDGQVKDLPSFQLKDWIWSEDYGECSIGEYEFVENFVPTDDELADARQAQADIEAIHQMRLQEIENDKHRT